MNMIPPVEQSAPIPFLMDAIESGPATANGVLEGLGAWTVQRAALSLIPEVFARDNRVLPLVIRDGELLIACPDPADGGLLQTVEMLTRHEVRAVQFSEAEILRAIADRYSDMVGVEREVQAFTRLAARGDSRSAQTVAASETGPVVQVVDKIISLGLRSRASDIHLEPQRSGLRVRFRIDGLLNDAMLLPQEIAAPIASRIKVMANLDIVDRHRSQDGQIQIDVQGRHVDIRVSTAETIAGEKVVLRLLDQARTILRLDNLGLSDDNVRTFGRLLRWPFGMVVVSGPTGSGKTTTLYAAINELDASSQNITTIEDPVEYTFENINQIQIRKVANLNFANGLRSILRQDPDVILVGEIRDLETAEIAVQSALTGHLVLTSLHATDAAAVVQRFIEMGIEGYLLSSALIGVVAQRLVRRICPQCRAPYELTPEEAALWTELAASPKTMFYRGVGCEHCAGTGYHGRVGVFEVLPLSDEVKRAVSVKAPAEVIRAKAVRDGMVLLRQDAVRKVEADLTTLSEVIRCVWVS
jgi:type IV pilus assembly protein PilB